MRESRSFFRLYGLARPETRLPHWARWKFSGLPWLSPRRRTLELIDTLSKELHPLEIEPVVAPSEQIELALKRQYGSASEMVQSLIGTYSGDNSANFANGNLVMTAWQDYTNAHGGIDDGGVLLQLYGDVGHHRQLRRQRHLHSVVGNS